MLLAKRQANQIIVSSVKYFNTLKPKTSNVIKFSIMSNEDFDLYEDLDNFHEQEQQQLKEVVELQSKLLNADNTIEQLRAEIKKYQKTIKTLETNFQLLLNTAKKESERQTYRITQLEEELNNIYFRRNNPNKNPFKSTEKAASFTSNRAESDCRQKPTAIKTENPDYGRSQADTGSTYRAEKETVQSGGSASEHKSHKSSASAGKTSISVLQYFNDKDMRRKSSLLDQPKYPVSKNMHENDKNTMLKQQSAKTNLNETKHAPKATISTTEQSNTKPNTTDNNTNSDKKASSNNNLPNLSESENNVYEIISDDSNDDICFSESCDTKSKQIISESSTPASSETAKIKILENIRLPTVFEIRMNKRRELEMHAPPADVAEEMANVTQANLPQQPTQAEEQQKTKEDNNLNANAANELELKTTADIKSVSNEDIHCQISQEIAALPNDAANSNFTIDSNQKSDANSECKEIACQDAKLDNSKPMQDATENIALPTKKAEEDKKIDKPNTNVTPKQYELEQHANSSSSSSRKKKIAKKNEAPPLPLQTTVVRRTRSASRKLLDDTQKNIPAKTFVEDTKQCEPLKTSSEKHANIANDKLNDKTLQEEITQQADSDANLKMDSATNDVTTINKCIANAAEQLAEKEVNDIDDKHSDEELSETAAAANTLIKLSSQGENQIETLSKQNIRYFENVGTNELNLQIGGPKLANRKAVAGSEMLQPIAVTADVAANETTANVSDNKNKKRLLAGSEGTSKIELKSSKSENLTNKDNTTIEMQGNRKLEKAIKADANEKTKAENETAEATAKADKIKNASSELIEHTNQKELKHSSAVKRKRLFETEIPAKKLPKLTEPVVTAVAQTVADTTNCSSILEATTAAQSTDILTSPDSPYSNLMDIFNDCDSPTTTAAELPEINLSLLSSEDSKFDEIDKKMESMFESPKDAQQQPIKAHSFSNIFANDTANTSISTDNSLSCSLSSNQTINDTLGSANDSQPSPNGHVELKRMSIGKTNYIFETDSMGTTKLCIKRSGRRSRATNSEATSS